MEAAKRVRTKLSMSGMCFRTIFVAGGRGGWEKRRATLRAGLAVAARHDGGLHLAGLSKSPTHSPHPKYTFLRTRKHVSRLGSYRAHLSLGGLMMMTAVGFSVRPGVRSLCST